jgi:hypothetical protein
MGRKLCDLFAIDARSLAAFRVAVGAIILVDVAIRSGDFAAHYTESGVLPLVALGETFAAPTWRWSLYTLSSDSTWPAVLLALTACCGALLVVGLATRVATAAAWVLVLSLHNRMPVIINAGDTLLHVLLLWAVFLPLSARWSLDAVLCRRRVVSAGALPDRGVCSPASAAILIQVALLYVCAGLFKIGNDHWWTGSSLYYVMSFDAYARPAATWMLEHPELLRLFTWATVALEFGGPLVAFCPWFTAPLRLLVILSFAGLHLGIETTMTVGLFSWVCAAGWLLYLPPQFWDWLARSRGKEATQAGEPDDLSPRRPSAAIRLAAGSVVLVLLAATVYWNVTGLPFVKADWRGPWARPVMELTGLRQQWRMFTRPPKHDGWPRALANLADGTEWDLLENEAGFDWKRRELPSAMAPNHRWRKYYNVLTGRRHAYLRPYFCRYLAAQFAAQHQLPIRDVLLYHVVEITGEPGEEDRLVRRLLHKEVVSSRGAFFDAAGASSGQPTGQPEEIHPGL